MSERARAHARRGPAPRLIKCIECLPLGLSLLAFRGERRVSMKSVALASMCTSRAPRAFRDPAREGGSAHVYGADPARVRRGKQLRRKQLRRNEEERKGGGGGWGWGEEKRRKSGGRGVGGNETRRRRNVSVSRGGVATRNKQRDMQTRSATLLRGIARKRAAGRGGHAALHLTQS